MISHKRWESTFKPIHSIILPETSTFFSFVFLRHQLFKKCCSIKTQRFSNMMPKIFSGKEAHKLLQSITPRIHYAPSNRLSALHPCYSRQGSYTTIIQLSGNRLERQILGPYCRYGESDLYFNKLSHQLLCVEFEYYFALLKLFLSLL